MIRTSVVILAAALIGPAALSAQQRPAVPAPVDTPQRAVKGPFAPSWGNRPHASPGGPPPAGAVARGANPPPQSRPSAAAESSSAPAISAPVQPPRTQNQISVEGGRLRVLVAATAYEGRLTFVSTDGNASDTLRADVTRKSPAVVTPRLGTAYRVTWISSRARSAALGTLTFPKRPLRTVLSFNPSAPSPGVWLAAAPAARGKVALTPTTRAGRAPTRLPPGLAMDSIRKIALDALPAVPQGATDANSPAESKRTAGTRLEDLPTAEQAADAELFDTDGLEPTSADPAVRRIWRLVGSVHTAQDKLSTQNAIAEYWASHGDAKRSKVSAARAAFWRREVEQGN